VTGFLQLRRHSELLGQNRSFRLLFLATFGSGIGTWLAVIALQVDIVDRTHSGPWVAALLVASILPSVAFGLVLGPLVDRLSRKALMIGSDLARLAVFVALPFAGSATVVVALALVAGVAAAFFRPAVLAGLPNMVEEDRVADANSSLQLSEWAATAGGPLVGGALVAASGPELAYWLNAATFLLSTLLVARIPGRLLQSEQSLSRGHWHDLREGFRTVRASRALVTVLVAWSIAMLASGGVNVAEIFLARESYGAGDFGFGLLWAASGVGLVVGSLVTPGWIDRHGLSVVYPISLVVFAFGIAVAAVAPNVWVGAAGMVVAGGGNGAAVIANITFVQHAAPDRLRGRAFTLLMSATYGVLLIAFLGAGPLTDAVGARWVYGLSAALVAVAAVAAVALGRRAAPAASAVEPAR
jgi:MFS family permease